MNPPSTASTQGNKHQKNIQEMENQRYSRTDAAAFKKEIEEQQKRMDETLARLEQGDLTCIDDWRQYKAAKDTEAPAGGDGKEAEETPRSGAGNGIIGRLKEAIEVEARENGTTMCYGKDLTANETLNTIADYARDVYFVSVRHLVQAVMYYVRYAQVSGTAKDEAEQELCTVIDNAHLYATSHEALSIFAGAVGRINEMEGEL